jgi:hypothetical protein
MAKQAQRTPDSQTPRGFRFGTKTILAIAALCVILGPIFLAVVLFAGLVWLAWYWIRLAREGKALETLLNLMFSAGTIVMALAIGAMVGGGIVLLRYWVVQVLIDGAPPSSDLVVLTLVAGPLIGIFCWWALSGRRRKSKPIESAERD